MQSGEGAPTISLQLVPKILAPLVSLWVPNAFVVSFKLETDENLLITKSRDSLNKYKHKVMTVPIFYLCFQSSMQSIFLGPSIFQLVIANILQTRKNRVIFVTPTTSYEVVLTREQALSGLEIEEPIVADVVSGIDRNIFDFERKQNFNFFFCVFRKRFANTMNSFQMLNINDPIFSVPLVILPFNVVLRCHIFVEFWIQAWAENIKYLLEDVKCMLIGDGVSNIISS